MTDPPGLPVPTPGWRLLVTMVLVMGFPFILGCAVMLIDWAVWHVRRFGGR
jgi:hypothetical protein